MANLQKNFVNLSGYIYNPQEFTTKSGKIITKFGMKIWCGKDKDGQSKYDFINLKYFGKLPEAKEIDLAGHLTVESYVKDNVTRKMTTVIVDKIAALDGEEQKDVVEFEDDDIEDLAF